MTKEKEGKTVKKLGKVRSMEAPELWIAEEPSERISGGDPQVER
jgi:hypothetical protein